MVGELDAGNPHVQFDEGAQETCDSATRLCPTLPKPRLKLSWFGNSLDGRFSGDPLWPVFCDPRGKGQYRIIGGEQRYGGPEDSRFQP
jgi:hypothetical protein